MIGVFWYAFSVIIVIALKCCFVLFFFLTPKQMLIMKKNPFKWSETAKNVNLPMMNISVKNDGKTVKPTSLPVAADVFIAMNCMSWFSFIKKIEM